MRTYVRLTNYDPATVVGSVPAPGFPYTLACCTNAGELSSDHRPAGMSAEASVRAALRERLLASQKQPPTAVDEFWVPQSHERADLAIIGRDLRGFEIKTERDTLRRLPRRVAAYGRIFDRCTAVVAPRHVEGALVLLPEWWGVVEVSVNGHVEFDQIRPARQNIVLDPETLVRLLWRNEVKALFDHLGVESAATATRGTMWKLLLDRADLRELPRDRSPARCGIGTSLTLGYHPAGSVSPRPTMPPDQ